VTSQSRARRSRAQGRREVQRTGRPTPRPRAHLTVLPRVGAPGCRVFSRSRSGQGRDGRPACGRGRPAPAGCAITVAPIHRASAGRCESVGSDSPRSERFCHHLLTAQASGARVRLLATRLMRLRLGGCALTCAQRSRVLAGARGMRRARAGRFGSPAPWEITRSRRDGSACVRVNAKPRTSGGASTSAGTCRLGASPRSSRAGSNPRALRPAGPPAHRDTAEANMACGYPCGWRQPRIRPALPGLVPSRQ
jgi:hypothetical protein